MAFSMKGIHSSPASHSLQRQAVLHAFYQEERSSHSLLAHTNSFANLPLYKTPPSIMKGGKPFNPFSRNLMERLECSTLSPTVFNGVISPGEVSSKEFRWTIDDVSRMKPAKIEESVHVEHVEPFDNETERSAQDAIERYFSKFEIPSPWDAPTHCSSPLSKTPEIISKLKTTTSSASSIETDRYRVKASTSLQRTCNASVQTCWSFPPVLPENVEAVLKPYFSAPANDNESDEQNLNTSTLRRKLNFTKENQGRDRFMCLSDESMSCDRVSFHDEMSSPIQLRSRMVTPLPMTMLSPPDVSPILNSSKSSHSRLMTRLDFTSTDCDIEESDGIRPTEMSVSACNMNVQYNNSEGCNIIDYDEDQQSVENDGSGNTQDTGYQTQPSVDKTESYVVTADSEIMETADNSMSDWTGLQACSTPSKVNDKDKLVLIETINKNIF